MSAIQVRDLVKTYKVHSRPPGIAAAFRSLFQRTFREVNAVRGISFDIKPGERVGFLGPNGAGKTTTLKMLAGLLHPTLGELHVAGHVPTRREDNFLKSIMLVMGQKQQLLWDLPPVDTFELNRAIYNVEMSTYKRVLSELDELLGLGELINRPTRQLSLGERMKCELAAALIHSPKVLFLDEPTIGLDVSMQVIIRNFIKTYNERTGATVILTSHYMDDVAALCPRVIVINHGALSYDGSLETLALHIRPEKRVTFRLSHSLDTAQPSARFSVQNWPNVTVVRNTEIELVLQVPTQDVRGLVTRLLGELPVEDLTVENAPLEEIMSEVFAKEGKALSPAGA